MIRFPRVFRNRTTFPGDEVSELLAIKLRIKDLIDFKFLFGVDNDGRRWWLSTSGNRIGGLVRLEEGDVENGVNLHRFGQRKPIGLGADAFCDGEGA